MFEPIKTGAHYGLPDEPFNFESTFTWTSALDEARRLGSSEIDSGHLLVAFLCSKASIVEEFQSLVGFVSTKELDTKNGLAYHALKNSGANLKDARRHLEAVIGRGDKPHKITKLIGRIPLDERPNSAQVSLIAKRAVDWHKQLGSKEIGDEHLLLALLDEPDEVVTNLLRRMQIAPERLRQTVLELANIASSG